MIRRLVGTAGLVALALTLGCAGASVKSYTKPAAEQRQYGKVKKVAILPLDSVVEGAQAPRVVGDLLLQALLTRGTFEDIEEPRYVAELMKKLKLRNTENLDREIVRKIGQELGAQALILGDVLLYGQDDTSEVVEFKLQLNMLDVDTGDILWAGSTYGEASTSWGEVLGVNTGPSPNYVARAAVSDLVGRLDKDVSAAREAEVERMLQAAEAQQVPEAEQAAPSPAEGEAAPPEEQVEEILLEVKPK